MGTGVVRRTDHVSIVRDTLTMVITVDSGLTGANVRCTIKRFLDNGDLAAIAQVDTDDGGVVVDSDTQCTVTFGTLETAEWPIGELWYDVQGISASGMVTTLARGLIDSLQRVTNTPPFLFTQVLPAAYESTPGNSFTSVPFDTADSQVWQWHYDSAQFAEQRPLRIREVEIRPNGATFTSFSFPSVEIVLAESSTDYAAANHLTTFADNILRSQVMRAAGPWSGPATAGWLPLGLTGAFLYDPSGGNDFIVQIRKCGSGTLMGPLDGQFAPGGTIGGNRYGHISNCAALTENFRNNEFVPIVRISYT
jgi:hypothetical protein